MRPRHRVGAVFVDTEATPFPRPFFSQKPSTDIARTCFFIVPIGLPSECLGLSRLGLCELLPLHPVQVGFLNDVI